MQTFRLSQPIDIEYPSKSSLYVPSSPEEKEKQMVSLRNKQGSRIQVGRTYREEEKYVKLWKKMGLPEEYISQGKK